jgi:hypothetical protein
VNLGVLGEMVEADASSQVLRLERRRSAPRTVICIGPAVQNGELSGLRHSSPKELDSQMAPRSVNKPAGPGNP